MLDCSVLLPSETGEGALLSYFTFHVLERGGLSSSCLLTLDPIFVIEDVLASIMDMGNVSFRNIKMLNQGHTAREW